MIRPRRIRGGVLAVVGYVLSPLSWWNDLLVNVPLAYAFATLVGLFWSGVFLPSVVVGYWLTNVAGFVLLHKGALDVAHTEPHEYTRWSLVRDLGVSVLYTFVVVALVQFGWLSLPAGIG